MCMDNFVSRMDNGRVVARKTPAVMITNNQPNQSMLTTPIMGSIFSTNKNVSTTTTTEDIPKQEKNIISPLQNNALTTTASSPDLPSQNNTICANQTNHSFETHNQEEKLSTLDQKKQDNLNDYEKNEILKQPPASLKQNEPDEHMEVVKNLLNELVEYIVNKEKALNGFTTNHILRKIKCIGSTPPQAINLKLDQIIYSFTKDGSVIKPFYSFEQLKIVRSRCRIESIEVHWTPTWVRESFLSSKKLINIYHGSSVVNTHRITRPSSKSKKSDSLVREILDHYDYQQPNTSEFDIPPVRFYKVKWETSVVKDVDDFVMENWDAFNEWIPQLATYDRQELVQIMEDIRQKREELYINNETATISQGTSQNYKKRNSSFKESADENENENGINHLNKRTKLSYCPATPTRKSKETTVTSSNQLSNSISSKNKKNAKYNCQLTTFKFINGLDFSKAVFDSDASLYPFDQKNYCEISAIHSIQRERDEIVELKVSWRPTWEDGSNVFCRKLIQAYASGQAQPNIPAENIRNEFNLYKVQRIMAHFDQQVEVNGVNLTLRSFLIRWHDTTIKQKSLINFFFTRQNDFATYLRSNSSSCPLTEEDIDRIYKGIEDKLKAGKGRIKKRLKQQPRRSA